MESMFAAQQPREESFCRPPPRSELRDGAFLPAGSMTARQSGFNDPPPPLLEVTSHGGKRVVEHVELPKLSKGYERLLHRARGAPSR